MKLPESNDRLLALIKKLSLEHAHIVISVAHMGAAPPTPTW
jgi:hypothetical protein